MTAATIGQVRPVVLAAADGESCEAHMWPDGSYACPFCESPVFSPQGWAEHERMNADAFARRGEGYTAEPYAEYRRRHWEARECPNPCCVVNMGADALAKYRQREREERERTEQREREQRWEAERAKAAEDARKRRTALLGEVRGTAEQLGFAWACTHTEPGGYGEADVCCMASGQDRGEYTSHMRGHGAKAIHPSVRPVRLRRKVPGATFGKLEVPVTKWLRWTEQHTEPGVCPCGHSGAVHLSVWAHEERQGCTECECAAEHVKPVRTSAERRGQFWAAGNRPRSVWVLPFEAAPWEDGSPALVLLTLPGKYSRAVEYSGHAGGQREAVRRADNVNARGVYAVTDGGTELRGHYRVPTYTVHADPGCPEAAELEHLPASRAGFTAGGVIQRVLKEGPEYGAPFCKRCVYLTDSEAAA